VPRLLACVAVLVGLGAFAETAAAQTTQLFPGVTYDRVVEFTAHGPVAISVVRGPRPVGLYRLRTVLSNESVLGRETVSSMERRLASQATLVGGNGDYSRFADGVPSGMLMRDGVLVTPPQSERSSVGITLDGLLDVRRVGFRGTWRGTGAVRTLQLLNKQPARDEIALFTSDWGRATPRLAGSFSVVLAPFPASVPDVDLVAPVVATAQGAALPLAPGTAVLVARGRAAQSLRSEATVGTELTLRVGLSTDWGIVADAIGGGPVLVRDGRPVANAGEAFTSSQIVPRQPRTAIGQTADGRLLMVVVDGRQPGYSTGMTSFELALTLLRLGAVRAMQLDGGGSSTVAFDGTVLNSPSDGNERPISTALMLQYYGVYASPPLEPIVSPNGDGVADAQRLRYKLVRPATATATLRAPDGVIAWEDSGLREAGTYDVAFPPPARPVAEGESAMEPAAVAEGRWTLTVTTTDDQGLTSTTVRRFVVNTTIGSLRVTPRLVVARRSGGRVVIRWAQTRRARVRVTLERRGGTVSRALGAAAVLPAGQQTMIWDGRARARKPVPAGRYLVRVTARNGLGSISLTQAITVRRGTG
jgi:hypothetical protein